MPRSSALVLLLSAFAHASAIHYKVTPTKPANPPTSHLVQNDNYLCDEQWQEFTQGVSGGESGPEVGL